MAPRLNAFERRFVEAMATSGNPDDAIKLANEGFSRNKVAYDDLLASPHIILALQIEIRRQLVADAPASFKVLRALRDNDDIAPKIRMDCAKTLLDRAGHVPPRAPLDKGNVAPPLHEMTTDELRGLADTLEGEIADRAKDVSSAPAAPVDTQDIDLVG